MALHSFSIGSLAPTLLLVLVGSVAAGLVLARVVLWLTSRVRDVPTSIIFQFIFAFGVWIVAERLGLSSVLTMVCFAVAVARKAPERTPARLRVPSYAVWDTAVFLLNVLAFVFIGLQIRPILAGLDPDVRMQYLRVAGLVLVTVIVTRIVFVLLHTSIVVWENRRFGFRPARPGQQPPTFGRRGRLVVGHARHHQRWPPRSRCPPAGTAPSFPSGISSS